MNITIFVFAAVTSFVGLSAHAALTIDAATGGTISEPCRQPLSKCLPADRARQVEELRAQLVSDINETLDAAGAAHFCVSNQSGAREVNEILRRLKRKIEITAALENDVRACVSLKPAL